MKLHRVLRSLSSLLPVLVSIVPRHVQAEPGTNCRHGELEQWSKPKKVRHRVAPRESLEQIAARYAVTVEQLAGWNALEPNHDVQRGDRLFVFARRRWPPRERRVYTVAPDDTWWRVAIQFGVRTSDLRAYNWPYRDKMSPGNQISVWLDPVIASWIAAQHAEEIRQGAVGIGPVDGGVLVNGVPIPPGPGYRLRYPKSAYGTTHAVEQVLVALRKFVAETTYEGTIELGSMSRPKGGELGSHQSHQTGRDLDINLPRRADVSRWRPLVPSRVDWAATWELIVAFASTDVLVIFLDNKMQKRVHKAAVMAGASPDQVRALLQYPMNRDSRHALVRHEPGHDQHIHVRFACGPCETECVQRTRSGALELDSGPH